MEQNIFKNERLLDQIDWQEIQNLLSKFFYFKEHNSNFFQMLKEKESSEVENIYNTVEKFINAPDLVSDLSIALINNFNSNVNFYKLIEKVDKGHFLGFQELNTIAKSFNFFLQVFKNISSLIPIEFDQNEIRIFKKDFYSPFRSLISPEGNINYQGHPELSSLSNKLNEVEGKISEKLKVIIRKHHNEGLLQYDSFDFIDDHYIIPVKSDHYAHKLGKIHGHSSSGHTLHVEPPAIKELTSKKINIQNSIDELLERYKINFSRICHENIELISQIFSQALEFDFYRGRSLAANDLGLNRPEFIKNGIYFKEIFHPLIEKPVLNDVKIDSNFQGLVISGPNTGGKTVTLKSIAISYIFVNLGLFVPAKKSQITFLNSLFYFSNDDQSLQDGLSSFASESVKYLNLLKTLSSNSLILIDEIFNTTSSDEASALAISLIQEIMTRENTYFFLTTHHNFLKDYLGQMDKVLSASVGFDQENLSPTYKIHLGPPGHSKAIEIFERLSREQNSGRSISKSASAILGDSKIDYQKSINRLEQKNIELDKLIKENKKISQELKNREQALKLKLQDKMDAELSAFRKELKEIERKALNVAKNTPKQVYKEFSKISEQIPASSKSNDKKVPSFGRPVSKPENGMTYFCNFVNSNVLVLEVNDRKKIALVSHKKAKLRIPYNRLFESKSSADHHNKVKEVSILVNKSIKGNLQIDCRGMRLEKFQHEVETSLSELLNGDIPFLTVVHGHGTGVLKNWLRNHLKNEKDFKWSNDEGNDGATRIELKS